MAILNMSAVQDALRTYYLPGLSYQMNEAVSPFFTQIEKTSENVVGRDIQMVLRYGKQGGIGGRLTDDADLPTPNSRKNKVAKWETKNIFARIMITDKTMKASQSSKGAFANLLQAELEDCLTDSKDQFNRMLFQDGSGVMAITAVNTATTTLTVNDVRFLYEGHLIDICDSAGTPKATLREVLAVDRDLKKITISGAAVTTTATDIITLNGSYGSELTGLDKIFKVNTSIYGMDRATNKWLNPVVRNIGGEISELAIQQAIDDAEVSVGGKINLLMTTYGVRRAYQNLLEATKRTVNTMELKGGYTAISYNGIGIVADKYQNAGTLDCLNTEDFKLYQMGDWDWLEEDGKILSRIENKPVYQASLVKYADLACHKLKGQTRLTGITER